MKKDFQSRFMPNVKFFMPNELQKQWCEIFYDKKQSVVDWAKKNINPNIVAFDDVEMNKNDDFVKFNQDKTDFSLVDSFAYEDLGKCLTFGAKKYSKNNWIKGDLDTYISALERHLLEIKKAVQTGDKQYFIDNDSTLQHGANLLCNAMFIHYFIRKQLEEINAK